LIDFDPQEKKQIFF